VAAAFLFVGYIVALASSRRRIFRAIPRAISIPVIGVLLALPRLLAASVGLSLSWTTVLWLFVGAAFGEEIFFRGYIQSRIDLTWGRPWRLLGFEFGTGLLISSLLFGMVHALNTVDYFHGRIDFNRRMGVQSIFVGAYYGLLRSCTKSVLAGAVVHGISDVLARIPNILRS
jgi:membrane protease YdiL (CAAX protease family)